MYCHSKSIEDLYFKSVLIIVSDWKKYVIAWGSSMWTLFISIVVGKSKFKFTSLQGNLCGDYLDYVVSFWSDGPLRYGDLAQWTQWSLALNGVNMVHVESLRKLSCQLPRDNQNIRQNELSVKEASLTKRVMLNLNHLQKKKMSHKFCILLHWFQRTTNEV